jgi:hypothetical protein
MAIPGAPTINDLASQGKYLQAPIYTPEQMGVQGRLLELGGQRVAEPTQGFEPIEQQAQRQFQTQTVPAIAERFTAMGGGQRSSAFQAALGRSGADLASQLGAQKAQYGLQQQGLGLQQAQAGLQPQYSQAYYQPSNFEELLGGQLGSAGGDFLQSLLKSPAEGLMNKLGDVLGYGGNKAAEGVLPAAAQGVVQGATQQVAKTVGQKATQALAPAAGTVAGSVLGTALTKGAQTVAPKALVAANPALAQAALQKAGGSAIAGAAKTAAAGTALGTLGTIAAVGGPIALGVTALTLMGWIAFEIGKGIFSSDDKKKGKK